MGVVCYTAVGKRNAVSLAARPKHSQSHFSLSFKLISNLCENPVGFVRLYPEFDPFHHSHSHQSCPPPSFLSWIIASASYLPSFSLFSTKQPEGAHVRPCGFSAQDPPKARSCLSNSFPISLSLAGSVADALASFLLLGSALGPAFMAPFYLEHSCPDGCVAYTVTSIQS